MNKSFSISFVFIFFCLIVVAQNNLNSYKYILVPKQFEFQKSEDQHQLNSLTKFLFNKANFTALFTDEQYPEDLVKNSCLALKVKINSNPSLLKTRMNLDLYDCYNKIVFSTKQAFSKEKVHKKAYQEAIRLTFVELEEFKYAYNGNVVQNKNYQNEPIRLAVAEKKQKSIEVKDIKTKKQIKPVLENKSVLKTEERINKLQQAQKNVTTKNSLKTAVKSIEGKFVFENWGISIISKKDNNYVIVGGDENFEFATIYKTSKPTFFIIKWVAYKQPQLVELTSDGNLVIDTNNKVKVYKRVD